MEEKLIYAKLNKKKYTIITKEAHINPNSIKESAKRLSRRNYKWIYILIWHTETAMGKYRNDNGGDWIVGIEKGDDDDEEGKKHLKRNTKRNIDAGYKRRRI